MKSLLLLSVLLIVFAVPTAGVRTFGTAVAVPGAALVRRRPWT
ncbi:hypothetical protein [Streptomyces chrestomyceticus]